MPGTISTSLTTGDTRAYIYPENPAYVAAPGGDNILYRVLLTPKPKAKEG